MIRAAHGGGHNVPDSAERPYPDRRADTAFFALAAGVGIATGTIGTVFHLIVDALLAWPVWLQAQLGRGVAAVVVAALVAAAMALASAVIVRRFAPEASGSGVQEVEGTLDGLRPLRWRRVLPVKFFAGILSLSSGLVLGREGPTIHMGASLGGALADWGRVALRERRGLIAAGAAAGLAAAFNAPIAAVLFVIEETRRQFPYTFRTFGGVIVASVLSAVITERIGGVGPNLAVETSRVPLWALAAFPVLGTVIGGLGVLFNRMILHGLELVDLADRRVRYTVPVAVGLLVGVLLIVLPEATGGNEALIHRLVTETNGPLLLLLLVAIRLVMSVASYVAGVPGGIFAPLLTLAAATGLAVGAFLTALVPDPALPVAFAVAAMGGLFTASVRAPLVGVVLVLELTGAYEVALPLLITCGIAHVTAEWLGGKPIYEQLLDRTLDRAGLRRPTIDARQHTGLA